MRELKVGELKGREVGETELEGLDFKGGELEGSRLVGGGGTTGVYDAGQLRIHDCTDEL